MRRLIHLAACLALIGAGCDEAPSAPTPAPTSTSTSLTPQSVPETATSTTATAEVTATTTTVTLPRAPAPQLVEVGAVDTGGSPLTSIVFGPDGLRVAVAAGPEVDVFDPTTGDLLRHLTLAGTVERIEWSPDGSLLATGISESSTVVVWDTSTWEPRYALAGPSETATWGFTPNGCCFLHATGSGFAFVTAATGEVQDSYALSGDLPSDHAFSPDGLTLAVVSSELVDIFRWNNGKVRPLREDSEFIHDTSVAAAAAVAWSPSGDQFATLEAPIEASIRLWSATGFHSIGGLGCSQTILGADWMGSPSDWGRPCGVGPNDVITGFAYSPSGNALAAVSGSEGRTYMWDPVISGLMWSAETPEGQAVEFVDPETLLVAGATLSLWDLPTGDLLAAYETPAAATALDISPDGGRLATGHQDGGVRFWSIEH